MPATGRNDQCCVLFVRRLIFAEASIAMDSKNRLLWCDHDLRIQLLHSPDHLRRECFERFLNRLFITLLVRGKPLLVVVLG